MSTQQRGGGTKKARRRQRKKKYAPALVQLFKRYRFTNGQVSLFDQLRAVPELADLSDRRMCLLVCGKKTFPKCLKTGKTFLGVLAKYDIDNVTIDQSLYEENEVFRSLIDLELCYFSQTCRSQEGLGIFYLDYGKWKPTKSDEERRRIVQVYMAMLEHFVFHDDNPGNVSNGIIFVVNFRGFGWENFDLHLETVFGEAFRCFPVRLKHIVLVNCPWYIKMVVGFAKPFMTPKMLERIVVANPDRVMAEYIATDHFLAQCGGTFELDYNPWIEEEFGIMVGRRRALVRRRRRKKPLPGSPEDDDDQSPSAAAATAAAAAAPGQEEEEQEGEAVPEESGPVFGLGMEEGDDTTN